MKDRPDPDQLLAQIRSGQTEGRRGKLKIFFGYAAGVGKTYAMLESAQRAIEAGRDLVLGYLEPHARPATQKKGELIETIPVQQIDYRGMRLREFDLDAVLARRPEIVLVDELAHSNVEGVRHKKRWQDVQELLEAGIDVWTTLNVQHIESLNDIVGQVTGVIVRETIPDHVFELANEIELVDLPPEDLVERLAKGEIYLGEQAKRAVQGFFSRSNLNALRELSLRQAASRVHSEVESARTARTAKDPWATAERILVCVGPSPTTAQVIRSAKRMASAFDAKWMAVSVELPGVSPRGEVAAQIAQHFRLAERLGAETLTLAGASVVETILDYARQRNITKILIGKTSEPRWRRFFAKSVVDRLIEASSGIDVYVIQGEFDKSSVGAATFGSRSKVDWIGHSIALLSTFITTLISQVVGFLQLGDSEANRVMLFLAGVVCVAFYRGAGPAITASIASVLAFDFFFVPPFLSFSVADTQYIVTFAVMLAVGLLVGTLTAKLRLQVENSRKREHRSNSLYELGRELSSLYGEVFLVASAVRTLGELLESEVVVYLKNSEGNTYSANGDETLLAKHPVSLAAAEWVIEHGHVAGKGTNTLPNAIGLFVPLQGSQSCFGAVAVLPRSDFHRLLQPDTRRMLEAGASQLALAIERDRLAIEAAESRLQAESEKLRSTLLSSVSHDLKTPLSSISGASSTLLESGSLDEPTRRLLLETISSEADRLNRLLGNIMQMSRLDAGATSPNLQWHVLEDIVGSALKHTSHVMQGHRVIVKQLESLPLVYTDDVLLEQVLVNLLENAAKYTAVGTEITITACVERAKLQIRVRDRGKGVPSGMLERIFEKFHRVSTSPDDGNGNGLGLAICRAIVKLLGGTISATNPPGGGAEFLVELPQTRNPPGLESLNG